MIRNCFVTCFMIGFLFLTGRIVSSPLTNVFQKRLTARGVSPLWIVFITYTGLSLVSIPLAVLVAPPVFPVSVPSDFWVFLLMMGLFDALGNLFLVKAVQRMDLSVFGPLNSFKPVIAMLLGIVVLGEIPGWSGLLGMMIILTGSVLLNPGGKTRERRIVWSAVFFRFAAMFFASLGAVFSKKVILMTDAVTAMYFWMWLGVPVLFIGCRISRVWKPSTLKHQWIEHLGVVFSIGLMQLFTLLTFERIQVGYALALFQLSSVLSVCLGRALFKEKEFKRRLAGAIIMVLGACTILNF